ncbi:DUF805 domain-containing protein [Macrococcus sp. EM39E]|uniref:DUF805 domain-containing protein n=1 Tax=Macrococcus animalis TaxID=3395467 RepID=UPI0039BDBB15
MQNDMTMKDAVIAFWMRGFQFSGRARRREYWLNVLGTLLIGFSLWAIIFIIDAIMNYRFHLSDHFNFFRSEIFPYIATIPTMAQTSRRLQDININGKVAIVIMTIDIIISFISTHVYSIFPVDFTNMGGVTPMLIVTFILLIPWLFLFICNFIRGNHGPNKYGEDPKQIM